MTPCSTNQLKHQPAVAQKSNLSKHDDIPTGPILTRWRYSAHLFRQPLAANASSPLPTTPSTSNEGQQDNGSEYDDDKFVAAMSLLSRCSPSTVASDVASIIRLAPELEAALICAVDVPSRVAVCRTSGREFLVNQCLLAHGGPGKCYRSPWNAADRYDPETLELAAPALPLEAATPVISVISILESKFNEAFDTYRLMYFDGGISSVYLHVNDCDSDEHALASFTVTVLIKKTLDQEAEWDSIHVVECSESDSSMAWTYRSTSSIILHLASSALTEADFSVGGSLVEQNDKTVSSVKTPADHIVNVGMLVEEIESKMRSVMQEVYLVRTRALMSGALRRGREVADCRMVVAN